MVREISPTPKAPSNVVSEYAALFNARDWDSLRNFLAEDVRLDQMSRAIRRCLADVGAFFSNYQRLSDWFIVPAWFEGREVLAVLMQPGDAKPRYFMEIKWQEERIAAIRDCRYSPEWHLVKAM